MEEVKDLTSTSKEDLDKLKDIVEGVAKKEEPTGGQSISLDQPRFNVMALNRKQRRGMKLPLVMWGAYSEAGKLLTAGTFSKITEWANNHRKIPINHKGSKHPLPGLGKRKFIDGNIIVRPIALGDANAFKSPIDLKTEPIDLKFIK